MSKFQVTTTAEICNKMSMLLDQQDRVNKKAIYAAANLVANQIRENLNNIPEESFSFLRGDEMISSISKTQKRGLSDCFGISPMDVSRDGDLNVKCGFSLYIDTGLIPATPGYPRGMPAAMLARSVESGSSVRKKYPFVRPAVNKVKKEASAEMAKIIEDECDKILKGK